MRLDGGQPLIPIFQWDAGVHRQTLGELVNVSRLPPRIAAHMEWIPHQQKRYFPFGHNLGQRGHISANIGPLERREALRGDAQRVADCQSNALFAQIEGKNAPIPCIFLVVHASV